MRQGGGGLDSSGLGHLSQEPRVLSLDGLHTLQLSSLWSSGTSRHPSSLPWHCQPSTHMFKRSLPAPDPRGSFLPTASLHLSPATPEKNCREKNFLESTPAKVAKSNSEESKESPWRPQGPPGLQGLLGVFGPCPVSAHSDPLGPAPSVRCLLSPLCRLPPMAR